MAKLLPCYIVIQKNDEWSLLSNGMMYICILYIIDEQTWQLSLTKIFHGIFEYNLFIDIH